jgi:SulP family sulfate permease
MTTNKNNHWISDLIAGLTTAIADMPDAMASAVLAGTNPIYGLYAIMVGKPVGALLTSSQFMTLGVTSAMALTAGSALAGMSGEEAIQGLFTLTLLVGAVQVIAGLLDLGRLMRYVSNAVMIGFLTGVSALVVLSQLGDFTGFDSDYSNKVAQAVDLLLHPGGIAPQVLVIGVLTVALVLIFDRTRLSNFSMLIALALSSIAVIALGWEDVPQVADIAEIPGGLPLPGIPDLALIPKLIAPAISIAIIGMVQGAGVSKGYPNPDGSQPDVSRDFSGQGVANIAAGLFQGMPLGGSVASTALNVSSGARSRWANVFAGLMIVAVVLLFSQAISLVAMPAMSALLIVAGVQSIKRAEFMDVWDVSMLSRVIMIVTLIATLMMPVQYAVFLGVFLSILGYFFSSADDVRLVELVPLGDGRYQEQPAPAQLSSNSITLLQAYGNLFFAAVAKLEERLPSPEGAERPVVILRLRQQSQIASTLLELLESYQSKLCAQGGKLLLAGVSPRIKEQLDLTETTKETFGEEDIFLVTDIVGDSTQQALEAAQAWLFEIKNLSEK